MPTDEPLSWGKTINRTHDEGRIVHLFQPNGAPACGVKYYTSGGAQWRTASSEELRVLSQKQPLCTNCKRIGEKRHKARETMAAIRSRGSVVIIGGERHIRKDVSDG